MAVRTRFIDLNAGSNGDGTEGSPYNSMANWQSGEATAGEQDRVTKAGDTIANIKGNENAGFTFSGWITSTTFRIELIVQAGSEGNGKKLVGGAGGAPYLNRTGAGGHVWLLEDGENYLIDGFEFEINNSTASSECIHMLRPESITHRNCLFSTGTAGTDHDGVTTDGGAAADVTLENCIFDQCQRAGIGIVQNNRSGTWTQTFLIDSCIFNENGEASESSSAGVSVETTGASSGTVNVTVKNSAGFNTDAASNDGAWNVTGDASVTVNWTGNDNCSDDTSTTGKFGSGSNNEDNISLVTADTSGSYRVTDLTTDSQDYTPVEVTTNDKCVNDGGTALTTDIIGTSRPQGAADDRGPFELVLAAPAGIEIFRRRIEGYK